jgi:type IV pilus assembly protein PilM
MFGPKAKYPIGIDIGDKYIFAAQLKKTRLGLTVRDLFYQELNLVQQDSVETDTALIQAFKAVAKHSGFKGKSVTIHLPSRQVYTFPINFEVDAGETLDVAIVRECRKYLSFPVEKAVIDYPSIVDISSGENRKFKASIIAAQRDQIDRHLRLLKAAGLSVNIIDFDLLSLLRLHRYLYSIKDDPVIFCNIGYRRSLMAIVTKDSILAHRNTHWGIQGLINRLETNFDFSDNSEQAAAMLNQYGLQYESHLETSAALPDNQKEDEDDDQRIYRTVFQVLTPYVDVLIHEFHQTIGYVRSELQSARFDALFLYGKAGGINSLSQYLEKRLDIPVTCMNPMLKLTLSDGSILSDPARGAPFALALGLAMRKVI